MSWNEEVMVACDLWLPSSAPFLFSMDRIQISSFATYNFMTSDVQMICCGHGGGRHPERM